MIEHRIAGDARERAVVLAAVTVRRVPVVALLGHFEDAVAARCYRGVVASAAVIARARIVARRRRRAVAAAAGMHEREEGDETKGGGEKVLRIHAAHRTPTPERAPAEMRTARLP
jgi:hypothetical protein